MLLCALVAAPGIGAQESTPQDLDDEEVEDESAQSEEQSYVTTTARAPIPAFAADRSINVVDEEKLAQRQAKSLGDALAEEAGISVQSTNRGAATLLLRGLVGPENVIYFDGVRFNQSTFRTGPNQYLSTIDAAAVGRAEVVRGPSGVLYGSGALGGTLQLFPHALSEEPTLTSTGGFESADSTAAGHVRAGAGDFGLKSLAGITYRKRGRLRAGNQGGGFFASALDGNEFLAAPYDELFWQAGAGWGTQGHDVQARYFGGNLSDAMRLDALGEGEVRLYDNEDHLGYLAYEWEGPQWLDHLRVTGSFHRTRETVRRRNCETVPLLEASGDVNDRVSDLHGCVDDRAGVVQRRRLNVDEVDTLGAGFTGVSRFLDSDLTVTWGGEAYRDLVESTREDARAPDFEFEPRDRGNFANGSTYTTVGAFGTAEYAVLEVGDSALLGRLGGRAESFSAFAPEVTEELGDVEYSFVGAAASAGVSYLYATNINAYATWNQGFRAPNLQETTVLGDSGNFYEVPNPELGPERSDTFELGGKFDWASVGSLQPAIWASLLSDRITREATQFDGQSEIDGKEVRHRVNRDSAYFYGFDIAAKTARFRGFSFEGDLAWVDGGVAADEPDEAFEAGPLHSLFGTADGYQNPRRLPPLKYRAGARYDAPENRWYLTLFVLGNAAQRKLGPDDLRDMRMCEASVGTRYADLGEDCPGSDGWATLNLRGGWRWEQVRFELALLNLTDQRYRPHGSGVPGAGIDLAGQMMIEY